MMRRRKNPQNLWLLLALPLAGAASWVAARLIRRRGTPPRTIPISGRRTASAEGNEPETGARTWEEYHTWEPARQESSRQEPGGNKEPWVLQEPWVHQEPKALEAPGKEPKLQPAEAAQELPERPEESPVGAGDPGHSGRAGHALENRPERLSTFLLLLLPFLILPVVLVVLAFQHIPVQSQVVVPGGSVDAGRAALQTWGCGACHTIPGVTGANGKVGPVLKGLSERSYIGGHLRNTPDNMAQWIMHPQQVSPGVDMPDSGVPESVARDMAAYLYSIR